VVCLVHQFYVKQVAIAHLLNGQDACNFGVNNAFWHVPEYFDWHVEGPVRIILCDSNVLPGRYRLKILFLTSQFPYPPHSGAALRAHGLIEGAVRHGHTAVLFSFASRTVTDNPFSEQLDEVILAKPDLWTRRRRLLNLILSGRADMQRRFWSNNALDKILTRLEQGDIDIIHAESLEMAAYLPVIHKIHPAIPLIYGSLNAEADLQRSMYATDRQSWRSARGVAGAVYSFIQWRRLLQFEGLICHLASHVLAVSDEDKRLLSQLSDTPVTVVKNGINVTDYLAVEPDQSLGGNAVVFTGTMDYRPNVDAAWWFANEILPHVNDAHFYIVGKSPHPRLDGLRDHPQITLTGYVEDTQPYFRGASVYVAPLRMGSGTRFKLMQAMASGIPIVSTKLGAMGLNVTDGDQMLLADDAIAFSDAINRLLSDHGLREQLSQRGREYVKQHFDWSVIVPELLKVYETLA
jgi:glycosyltransferase involved in cell wall biosynthesis